MRNKALRLAASAVFAYLVTASERASAQAEAVPVLGPSESWIVPVEDGVPGPEQAQAPLQTLLFDMQLHLEPGVVTAFAHVRIKIADADGLAQLGTVPITWSPATDTVTLHRFHLVRDGAEIDLRPTDGHWTVLRREAGLAYNRLDGQLTVALQPEGVAVNDVLDFAFSIRHAETALGSNASATLDSRPSAPAARWHVAASWPTDMKVRRSSVTPIDGLAERTADGRTTVEKTAENVSVVPTPARAPTRFAHRGQLDLTTFRSWPEVSALLWPRFEAAARLDGHGELAKQARAIAARAGTDRRARAEAALRLAQDDVRYGGAPPDFGFVPADAETTWTRRFGDCKGKTALLLALLRALDIEAEPVLVSTDLADGLSEHLPMLSFNHAVVRARIDGRDFWLDATARGEHALERLAPPVRGWVLPVSENGSDLHWIDIPDPTEPREDNLIRVDWSAGFEERPKVEIEFVARGAGAAAYHIAWAALSDQERTETLHEFAKTRLASFIPEHVDATYDAEGGIERVVARGTAALDGWKEALSLAPLTVGWKDDFTREDGPDQDAPFAVVYPYWYRTREEVTLPKSETGFRVEGEKIDTVAAGYALTRWVTLDHGVVKGEASVHAVAAEISAAQAAADKTRLAELVGKTVRLVPPAANGAAEDIAAALAIEPKTAADFIKRGNAYLEHERYAEAQKDLEQAVSLDPDNSHALAMRGLVHAWRHQYAAATADLAAAEAIDPREFVIAHARGLLAEFAGDLGSADTAYTLALGRDPNDAFSLSRRAIVALRQQRFEASLTDIDRAVALQPSMRDWLRQFRVIALAGLHRNDDMRAAIDEVPAGDDAKDRLIRAKLFLGVGDRAAAQAEAQAAIDRQPSVGAFVIHGRARDAKDAAGMRQDAEAALAIDPNDVDALALAGQARIQARDYAGALPFLDRLVAREPGESAQLITRARVRAKAGQTDAAVADYLAARDAEDDPQRLNDVCYGLAAVGRALDDALASCDRALLLAPHAAHILDSRAFTLLKLGRNEEAIAAYGEALKADPKLAIARFGRGLAERRIGLSDAAERDRADAVATQPQLSRIFAELGVVD